MRRTSILLLATTLTVGCTAGDDTDDTDDSDTDTDVHTDTDTDTDTPEPQEDLSINGRWVDSWGSAMEVNNTEWTIDSATFQIDNYDNENRVVIAQNDAANEYNPDLWSRFDWTMADGELWVCQTAYDADSLEAAESTPAADPADPANGGCGTFAWSQLREPLTISGDYTDAFGGAHTITAFSWTMDFGVFHISAFDNDALWLVAQNDEENDYNPGEWSRMDWVRNEVGLWFCQIVFDAASEVEALETAAADNSDPATAGCGDFSWTLLE